jgi:hypothetical protein
MMSLGLSSNFNPRVLSVFNETVYGFRVRARNIFSWGPYSLVTQIKTARETGTPFLNIIHQLLKPTTAASR